MRRCRGAVRLSQLDRLLKIGVLDHAAVTVIRNTSLSVLAYFNPWQHKCRSSDGRIRQGDEVATVQRHFHVRQIRPFQVDTVLYIFLRPTPPPSPSSKVAGRRVQGKLHVTLRETVSSGCRLKVAYVLNQVLITVLNNRASTASKIEYSHVDCTIFLPGTLGGAARPCGAAHGRDDRCAVCVRCADGEGELAAVERDAHAPAACLRPRPTTPLPDAAVGLSTAPSAERPAGSARELGAGLDGLA